MTACINSTKRHLDVMDLKTDEDEYNIEMHLPYTAKMMERLIAHVQPCI